MNLTDVDDRTIRNARAAGLELRDYTAKFIEAFDVDRQLLCLETPEVIARATDHIDDMAALVQTLIDKGDAYRAEGAVYFRVGKFQEDRKLSQNDFSRVRPVPCLDS